MSIMHITEETFDKEVLEAPVPVLVDFWADWCGPCRMLAPTIDELEQKYRGKIHVGKIDIDRQPKLALVHKVMSIPTVSIYSHGKEVKRLIGLRDKSELDEVIQEVLAKEYTERPRGAVLSRAAGHLFWGRLRCGGMPGKETR